MFCILFCQIPDRSTREKPSVNCELIDDRCFGIFDETNQFLCGKLSDRFCVLAQRCQPGLKDAGKSESIISCDGNIIWYPKSSFVDFVDTAQSRKIIRIKNAGRRIFQIKKF